MNETSAVSQSRIWARSPTERGPDNPFPPGSSGVAVPPLSAHFLIKGQGLGMEFMGGHCKDLSPQQGICTDTPTLASLLFQQTWGGGGRALRPELALRQKSRFCESSVGTWLLKVKQRGQRVCQEQETQERERVSKQGKSPWGYSPPLCLFSRCVCVCVPFLGPTEGTLGRRAITPCPLLPLANKQAS